MPTRRAAKPEKKSTYKPSPRLDGKPAHTRREPQPWPAGLDWGSTAVAAAYLGIHPDDLSRRRRHGDGPKYSDLCGVRYRKQWCDEWLEKGAKTSTSEVK